MLGILLIPILVGRATANTWAACQAPKASGQQLQGCPNSTLYVSQTDPLAPYGSISAAVNTLNQLSNDTTQQYILVGPGEYHEPVNVTRKGPITIMGVTSNPNSYQDNQVLIWNSSYINQTTQLPTQHNADACVLTVGPYGPGCSDFKMYNIDVANRAVFQGIEYNLGNTGPSAALFVSYGNASFYQCTFRSYQDTLYVGTPAGAVFVGGEVAGSTDYIYGYGTAYFVNTTLANRGNGGGIVAWKGSPGNNTYGAYFNRSSVVAASDPEPGVNLTATCALGRPWNNMSRAVFSNTYMSEIVLPQGFIEWQASDPRVVPNLTIFVESGSYGPGYDPSTRNYSVEAVISVTQAEQQYTVSKVFNGWPSWIDQVYLPQY